MRVRRSWLCLLLVVPGWFVLANPEAPKSDYNPPLAKASDEAVKAIPQFKRDRSLTMEVWAAEPMLAHPVAFAFDEQGRCYVAETFRHSRGVTDNRSHMNWLDDELALRTVAERVELYRKDAKAKFKQTYETERERVRLLVDSTGSGKADQATIFRDDFGRAEDGIGAGLLARQGNVYYTCIPDVWLLKDTKNAGQADVKQSLSTGYGVHTAFIGHDLHGLRIGPDGKLYFTVGDRGLNVTAIDGKKIEYPDAGAVLRCDLDGRNLEMVATGLRNPQELAFDDYGNLFTVDNNSDGGDQARFVHIVEGGDSGWRIGYQYGSGMHDATVKFGGNRGPWHYELLWKPQADNRAAYVLPPLVNYSNGPSGFTAYPGVGLSDRYKNHFFLANFSGQPGASGIYSFATKPKGASFEMTDAHQFIWNILATDCDFGPDGGFYISDWVSGWNINGKGRMYRVTDAEAMKNPAVGEAKSLLKEGFTQRNSDALVKLLAHPHREVRQEAHFALAAQGATKELAAVATKHEQRLARIHALWALGMIGRKDATAYAAIAAQLTDADVEVRACAARLYGEAPQADVAKLVPLLADAEPRVQMMAALGLARGSLKVAEASTLRPALFALLKANADRDPVLRHAASEALAKRVDAAALAAGAAEESPAVRLGCVLALRKQRSVEVAMFLNDSDSKVVDEAARAINDQLLVEAYPKLAALSAKSNLSPYTAYRVLNAHYLMGTPANAQALANEAARADRLPGVRALALKMLANWANPPRRDYITGLTQKLAPRSPEVAVTALTSVLGKVFASPDVVQKEAVNTASKLGIKQVGPFLLNIANDPKAITSSRIDALQALQAIKDPSLNTTATKALTDADPQYRNAGRGILFKSEPAKILGELKSVLAGTNILEQQGALALLAANPSKDTDALLEAWLDRANAKQVPAELLLDVLEAASGSKAEGLKQRVRTFDNNRPKDDGLANYRETIAGGDARRGRDVLLNHTAAQCQRCHLIDGQGGEVGPPLNGVGKQTREYLLEAIVLPSKAIAKGYETVAISTLDGKTVTGIIRAEDAKEVKLITAEGKTVIIKKDNIDERKATKSAMPDDLAPKMTKRELRDLVEYLATLKEEWKKP